MNFSEAVKRMEDGAVIQNRGEYFRITLQIKKMGGKILSHITSMEWRDCMNPKDYWAEVPDNMNWKRFLSEEWLEVTSPEILKQIL